MSLTARAAIRAMPAYAPPREGRTGLRLDFNENTVGCSPKVLEALRAATAEDLARYPEYNAAERGITAAFGHSPETALVTNGVDDAIWLAVVTFLDPGDEAIVVAPTFAMYRFYCQQAAVTPVEVVCENRGVAAGVNEFRFSADAILAAVTPRTRVVFVANPNNPTGHYTREEELLALARRLPECLIFIDEAYADFVSAGHRGLLDAVAAAPNLVVARTFSKAYGLAGARLGCLFAPAALMPMLRKAHSPYNVNTLALRCGLAALSDRAWADDYRRQVIESRGIVESTLAGLAIPFWRSRANFVLFETGARTTELITGLRQRGILIRDRRADWPGAARITCGTVEQTRDACAALAEIWRQAEKAGA